MHNEYHVACLIGDDCVVMGGHIVKKYFILVIVSLVGLACVDASELRAVSMVDSTPWP